MNKRINGVLAIPLSLFFLIASVTSCKQKTSDADLKTAVEKSFAGTGGGLAGANVDVKDGVVTLTGEVKTETEKNSGGNIRQRDQWRKICCQQPDSGPSSICAGCNYPR